MTPEESNPYAATPATLSHAPIPLDPTGALQDPTLRGYFATTFILLTAVADAIAGWLLHARLLDENFKPVPELDSPFAVTAVALLHSFAIPLLTLLAGVTFLMWTHRCVKNAQMLEGSTRFHSAGMAVGSHFIPVYNFFGPLMAFREMTKNTFRCSPCLGVEGLVVPWWMLWIACNLLGLAQGVVGRPLALAVVVSTVAAAILVAIIIARVSKAQATMPATALLPDPASIPAPQRHASAPRGAPALSGQAPDALAGPAPTAALSPAEKQKE